MQDYFEPFFAAVRKYDGVISNVTGDGTLCAWKTDPGVLQAHVNAIRATLEYRRRLTNSMNGIRRLPFRHGLGSMPESRFTAIGGFRPLRGNIIG